jgi:uncharacterized protein (TIGR00296 family)
VEALIDSAISSAVNDPRFHKVTTDELRNLLVEVSILTPPELIVISSPREYPEKVKVGEDGLIVKWSLGSGLLLPQVSVEYNWTAEEFLSNACMKAGATPDYWLTYEAKIYKFKAIIFEEVAGGQVVRKLLK